MRAEPTVTRDDICRGLHALGICGGDTVLVHSSLSRFGHVDGGADAVIDGLLAAVGEGGTLVMPTLTHGRVNALSPVFDVRRTPCSVGLIPETFRQRPGVRRSLHPTHSCAAAGPRADELLAGHETQVTPCGSRSPYQRLMAIGASIVLLGVDLNVNTSFHALEEMACVPWLFDRFEALQTIDAEGRRIDVPSRRHSDGMPRDFPKVEPVLGTEGALRRGAIGAATVRVVDAAAMERVLVPLLAEDPFLLLAPEAAAKERARWCAPC